MVLTAIALLVAQSHLYDFGPYDSSVPKPESILGYPLGARQTTYREQEQVVRALVMSQKAKAREIWYGSSVEGRPLRIVVISSEANMKRLETIRQNALAIANGKPVPQDQPAIVWINQCIHGNEPASFESSMWTLYTLVASRSPQISKTLENTVVVLNPSYNPDGHERFAVWNNSISTGVPGKDTMEHIEPGVIHGRTNHYRFDMNRDRVAMSQPETQQEVSEFLRWRPQVYVDQHGQTPNYFFPPNPMSVNPNVDRPRFNKWTDIFGASNGALFDKNGWQYFVKDVYDLYYAGYLDSFASLSGAIGMTYETDGGYARAKYRNDGTVVTLEDGAIHHLNTAINTIMTASQNQKALLETYSKYLTSVVNGDHAGKFKRVVLTSKDPRPLVRFQKHLAKMGIESFFTAGAVEQQVAHDFYSHGPAAKSTFPAGSLVVDMNQSQGALAKAMLEAESNFEPEFVKAQLEKRRQELLDEKYPGAERTEFYDLTGWSLVYLYNLQGSWCEDRPGYVKASTPTYEGSLSGGTTGFAIRYEDEHDLLAVHDLVNQGYKALVGNKLIKIGNDEYLPGTVFFMKMRNPEGLERAIAKVAAKRKVKFVGLDTTYPQADRYSPGSENMVPVRQPKIGLVFGDSGRPSFSGMWYLMEKRFDLPFEPIGTSALSGDLSSYSCLIFPDGFNYSATDKVKDWLNAGGCAVVLGDGWANGAFAKLEPNKLPSGKAPGGLPGSIFLGQMDARSFLARGYIQGAEKDVPIALPVEGDAFYKAKAEGGTVVSFSNDEKFVKLLTGWVWPNDTELGLKGAAWLQDVPVGQGHVILFTNDPSSRALYPGLYKMLLNAVLFGPAVPRQ